MVTWESSEIKQIRLRGKQELQIQELQSQDSSLEQISKELRDIKTVLDLAVILSITDNQGIITFVNQKFCDISQYSQPELLGQTHRILNSGCHPPEFFRGMWTTISSGKIWRNEIKNRAKDGSLFWVDATIIPSLDQEGNPCQYIGLFSDITHRKDSEEKLASLSTFQQAILDSANFSIISTDLNGIIQSFNAGAEALLGYSASEVVGKTSPAIFHVLDEIVVRAAHLSKELQCPIEPGFEVFVAKAKRGEVEEREWVYIRKDGSRFPVLLSITAIRTTKGDITGFMGIAKDLTDQRQIQNRIENFTSALDKTAILAITDKHGTITFVNDKFCEISQYPKEELIGKTHRILNSGHHPANFFKEMWKTISGGKTWRNEIRNRAKDGSFYWVDTTIVPFLDEYGKPYQYLAIRIDITPRKEAESELRKLSLIVSKTDNVAIITDTKGQIEWVNESFYTVTGYTLEEVQGKKPGNFLQGVKTDQATVASIRYALALHQPFSGEILNYHKDGHPYWLHLQINPVFDEEENLTHFVAIESEITTRKEMENSLKREVDERKRAVEELRKLSERLEVSNRELQDFAYVSSHDLQEPLRKIQAFGDRLKINCQDSLNEKGLDYLDRMLNAANRAQTLINDLLSFSRVTSKAKPFEKVDLSEILEGVLSDLETRIEQTEATLEVDPLPVVDADPLQMRQILQNLIGNALKFSKEGIPPIVQVRSRINVLDGQEKCEIRIIDNGIGFEQKYADRIFQIFQRLHGRGTYEGTGIGLAICRKIAERHYGTLIAESEPDQGTTFKLTIPMHQLQEE